MMNQLQDGLDHLLKNLSAYGTALSSVLTVASVLAATIGKAILVDRPAKKRNSEISISSRTRDSIKSEQLPKGYIARAQVLRRLKEANNTREREQTSAKVTKWTANLLVFAQVVIGGVLASSFVQQSLSAQSIGLLGVLVLIASLINQQYRPEVNAQQSKQKAAKLQALMRTSEDQLVALDARSTNGEDRTDAFIELAARITQGLNEIESPETHTRKTILVNGK